MSTISGVSTTQSLLNAFDLDQTSSTDTGSDDSDAFAILESKGSSATNISTAASLLSSLSTMQKNNPTGFKETASEISSDLRGAADDEDTLSAYELNKLAGLFSNAASSGSLTSLTSSSGSSSLKSYGTTGGLLSTYLSGSLGSGVFSTVNSIISNAISSTEFSD